MLASPLELWLKEARERAPMQEATLTSEVISGINNVDLPHRDPVDWFLAATAHVYGLTLVTADKNLRSGCGFDTLY